MDSLIWSLAALTVTAPLLWAAVTYNRLIRLRNRLREGWSGIEVQLKRRWELVPNLVSCVEAYQKHEREVLEQVTRHRAAAASANGISEANGAETVLGQDLGRLILLAEDYPELKADTQFRELATCLVEIEDALQYARRYYNGCVRDQNNLAETFPNLLVARAGGFRSADFFEVENEAERTAPSLRSFIP